jgi:hypothetical protein
MSDQAPPKFMNESDRIRAACADLERALAAFDITDGESAKKARAESEKLYRLREQLLEIRRQLDELSK